MESKAIARLRDRRFGVPVALLAGLLLGACGDSSSAQADGPPEDSATGTASAESQRASEDWALFRGTQGLGGVAAGRLPDNPELLWSFEVAGAITSSPVVKDGRVYFGADDNNLHCVDVASGEELWSFATEDMIEAPPSWIDGTVYIGSNDFFFYAIDAISGELRWKYETGDKIMGAANYIETEAGLCIVVGSYDNNLYGLRADNGEKLWHYATDNFLNGTPAVDGDITCFGGCDAILHVVSVMDGSAVTSVPLGSDSQIAGSVAIEDGKAYFGHYGNQFVCIDLATQETLWHYDSDRYPFFSSPSLTADRVLFGGRDKHMHCVKKSDGTPIWKFRTGRKIDSSPVVCGDKVVFGSGDGRLYMLDLKSGTETWSYDIGKPLVASPAVQGGKIFVGCNDGKLYVFGESKAP